ncbi:hypothetical protein HOU00_gp128 [Caulobacter phage CcrPW]|uniref:Uncharacterized protein n=1 Tax=Caulobacter phage CcrPW TaxID=2283271 RepID=A0A385ECK4_9CAUD|nr:hypothetical protein HOU00_gp008 [Caulobacter phage CcrPW]YP_009809627.1 hypothetical protein HOU00_gp128 [Caulobacter phage CcrPW]AXQ68547.1 hypothetical protein CcrPW_gp008 [Caulobacter phage CcrPW]AXQ68997.1 hypothetical protein CcrPW_gp458 [Caulobacter phage CcrPW]
MSTLPVRTLAQIGHLTWVATRKGAGFDAAFADSDDAIRHAMNTGGNVGHTLLGWIDMFSPSATFEENQRQVAAFLERGDEFDRVMGQG